METNNQINVSLYKRNYDSMRTHEKDEDITLSVMKSVAKHLHATIGRHNREYQNNVWSQVSYLNHERASLYDRCRQLKFCIENDTTIINVENEVNYDRKSKGDIICWDRKLVMENIESCSFLTQDQMVQFKKYDQTTIKILTISKRGIEAIENYMEDCESKARIEKEYRLQKEAEACCSCTIL